MGANGKVPGSMYFGLGIFTAWFIGVTLHSIYWSLRFWAQRGHFGYVGRKKSMIWIFLAGLLCWFLSRLISQWFEAYGLFRMKARWAVVLVIFNTIMTTASFATLAAYGALRAWLIYYECCLATANSDNQWIQLITAPVVYHPIVLFKGETLLLDVDGNAINGVQTPDGHTEIGLPPRTPSALKLRNLLRSNSVVESPASTASAPYVPGRLRRGSSSRTLTMFPSLSREKSIASARSSCLSVHGKLALLNHDSGNCDCVIEEDKEVVPGTTTKMNNENRSFSGLSIANNKKRETLTAKQNWFFEYKHSYGNRRWWYDRFRYALPTLIIICAGPACVPEMHNSLQYVGYFALLIGFTLILLYLGWNFPQYSDTLKMVQELRTAYVICIVALVFTILHILIERFLQDYYFDQADYDRSTRARINFYHRMTYNVIIMYSAQCLLLTMTKWVCLSFPRPQSNNRNKRNSGQPRLTNRISFPPMSPNMHSSEEDSAMNDLELGFGIKSTNNTLTTTTALSSPSLSSRDEESIIEIRNISRYRALLCLECCFLFMHDYIHDLENNAFGNKSNHPNKSGTVKSNKTKKNEYNLKSNFRKNASKDTIVIVMNERNLSVAPRTDTMLSVTSMSNPSLRPLKLSEVISDESGFRFFMRHLFSEFSYESLLCVVELRQFGLLVREEEREAMEPEIDPDEQPLTAGELEPFSHHQSIISMGKQATTAVLKIGNSMVNTLSVGTELTLHLTQSSTSDRSLGSPGSTTTPLIADAGRPSNNLSFIPPPPDEPNPVGCNFPPSVCTVPSSIVHHRSLSREQKFCVLVEKYILLDAEMSINISFDARQRLVYISEFILTGAIPQEYRERGQDYCVSKLSITSEVFDEAIYELMRLMRDAFTRFQCTAAYQELQNIICNDGSDDQILA